MGEPGQNDRSAAEDRAEAATPGVPAGRMGHQTESSNAQADTTN
jgi:hypothetical protein